MVENENRAVSEENMNVVYSEMGIIGVGIEERGRNVGGGVEDNPLGISAILPFPNAGPDTK